MQVVLNADDFGLSHETVAGSLECFERGALTSATIMARMPATGEAIDFALAHPEFSFGVHLTFAGADAAPVSDPAAVSHLVDADGRFLATREVRMRALTGRLPVGEIAREVRAQVASVRDAGVPVSHVDSHRHLHKFAPFRAALRLALPDLGVCRVRAVQDVWLRRPLRSPTHWLGPLWRRRLARSFVTTPHFYMPSSAGDRGWDEPLLKAMRSLPGGVLEVGVHPGFDDELLDDERRSVQRFARRAREAGHRLVPWSSVEGES